MSRRTLCCVVLCCVFAQALLHYRSALLEMLDTVLLFPLYAFGIREQSQALSVPFFERYTERRVRAILECSLFVRSTLFARSFCSVNSRFNGVQSS